MNNIDLLEIGNRIRKWRSLKGYTQEQVAELMDVSVQMYSNLERGRKAIRIENLVSLCRVMDVSIDYILTGKIFVPKNVDEYKISLQILKLLEELNNI